MPAVGPPDQTRPPASPLQRDMWLCDIDDTRFQPGPQEFRLRVSSGNLADGLIDQAAAVLAAVIRGPAPAGSHPVATSVMRSGWDGGQTAAEVWVSQSTAARISPASFDAVFQATGTRILISAVQAPRMNATCERPVGTLRREVFDRTLILGEAHLRAVLTEYQAHYNTARPHLGIAQHVPGSDHHIPRAAVTDPGTARIHRRPVLGGLINEYTHAA